MLLAIMQAVLQTLMDSGLFRSVFLTPQISDEWGDLIPPSARLPGAGVCDGPEEAARDLAAGGRERRLELRVSVYVSAEGESTRQVTELQTLSEQVVDLLDRNTLGLADVILAEYAGGSGSVIMDTPAGDAARKTVTIRYVVEESHA